MQPNDKLLAAIHNYHSGNYIESEQIANEILEIDPNNTRALNLLGMSLHDRGLSDEGIIFVKRATEVNPDYHAAHNNLGTVYRETGRFELALLYIDRAIAVNPASSDYHLNRASVLDAMGDYEKSLDSFEKAISLNPNLPQAYVARGSVLHKLHRFAEALANYDKAIKLQPTFAKGWEGRSRIYFILNRYEESLAALDRLMELEPDLDGAWLYRGDILLSLKRYDEALTAYEKSLKLKPGLFEAWVGVGNVLGIIKQSDEALAAYDRALTLNPDLAEAWAGRGNIFAELNQYDNALAAYNRALTLQPDLAGAGVGRGNILMEVSQYDNALAAFDRVLTLNPDLAEAWTGRGNIFTKLNQYDNALAAYDRALTLNPDLARAWVGRGNIFMDLNQHDNALAAYDRALTLQPDLAGAWVGRGNILKDLKQYNNAFAAYDRALILKPDLAEAWLGRGNIFAELNQYDNAFAAYDRALTLKPDLAEAWTGRGNIFTKLKQYDSALAAFDSAITIKRHLVEAWHGRGHVLSELMRHDEAVQSNRRLLELAPNYHFAKSFLLHEQMSICDWHDLDFESINRDVRERKKSVEPWPYQAISNSVEDHKLCAEIYCAELFPRSPIQVWSGERYNNPKIRIGYLSGDFRNHPVSILMTELFELHNKDHFELYAFDNCWDDGSEIRKRINKAFDFIIDITRLGDLQAATIINQNKIDILVNLIGHTGHERTAVFSHRPSPVQVNYLGFSGTMGADYIDYILADKYIIPPEQQIFYTEKVVYLPDTYQVSDSKRTIADRAPTRSELMLPDTGFIFCCFNNTFKITPAIFDVWMRLLKEAEGSVLWLSESSAASSHNLRLAAKQRGIAPERLVITQKAAEYSDYLARYRLADLFLDTFPFNAGTTANDVLWAGTPLITCSGETYPARMAGSLLSAIGIPELITRSLDEYESLALKLARDPNLIASIKAKLRLNHGTHPLFDTARFARHIESAYTTMWERSQRGEPPASFSVKAL